MIIYCITYLYNFHHTKKDLCHIRPSPGTAGSGCGTAGSGFAGLGAAGPGAAKDTVVVSELSCKRTVIRMNSKHMSWSIRKITSQCCESF